MWLTKVHRRSKGHSMTLTLTSTTAFRPLVCRRAYIIIHVVLVHWTHHRRQLRVVDLSNRQVSATVPSRPTSVLVSTVTAALRVQSAAVVDIHLLLRLTRRENVRQLRRKQCVYIYIYIYIYMSVLLFRETVQTNVKHIMIDVIAFNILCPVTK